MKMPAALIREEICKRGAISFARFMELALYCPETGYYETKEAIVGQRGDFITSVSTGPLFGQLLAFQFAEWLQELPVADGQLPIAEAGAHGGQLAGDILAWLQSHRPQLFERLEYIIVEPSFRRSRWQEEALRRFTGKVRWVSRLSDLRQSDSFAGIVFSNELLDAFPVSRLGWDRSRKAWFEWGVAIEGEKFVWSRLPPSISGEPSLPASIRALPSSLLEVLPDNYIVETSPAAEEWWSAAARTLSRGRLLAIDYGFTDAADMFSPARLNGTLRAYDRHQVSGNLLAQPGEQDLTAHVNFPAIQQAGEAAGLKTERFCSQPQFLAGILQKAVAQQTFTTLDTKQVRQFQTLTHPDHLGRAFRVLVQARS
jgi:SAM-dependent MidA family methyltransferase